MTVLNNDFTKPVTFDEQTILALAYAKLMTLPECISVIEENPNGTHFDIYNKVIVTELEGNLFKVEPSGTIDVPDVVKNNFLPVKAFKRAVLVLQLMESFNSLRGALEHIEKLKSYRERFGSRTGSGVINILNQLTKGVELFKASEKIIVK